MSVDESYPSQALFSTARSMPTKLSSLSAHAAWFREMGYRAAIALNRLRSSTNDFRPLPTVRAAQVPWTRWQAASVKHAKPEHGHDGTTQSQGSGF